MRTAILRSALCAAFLQAAAGNALADYAPFQGYVEMPNNLAPMVMGNLGSENLRHLIQKQAQGLSASGDANAAAGDTLARPGGPPTGPRALAANAPADQRAALEGKLTQVLGAWQQIEKSLRLPQDDVASAVAACIAGSYMVVHDVDLPDADFAALVGQMRTALLANARFTQAPPAQRREMYEELAIIGTLMALGREAVRQGKADPKALPGLRRNAQANLDRLLGADSQRAVIDEHGLAYR